MSKDNIQCALLCHVNLAHHFIIHLSLIFGHFHDLSLLLPFHSMCNSCKHWHLVCDMRSTKLLALGHSLYIVEGLNHCNCFFLWYAKKSSKNPPWQFSFGPILLSRIASSSLLAPFSYHHLLYPFHGFYIACFSFFLLVQRAIKSSSIWLLDTSDLKKIDGLAFLGCCVKFKHCLVVVLNSSLG